MKHVDPRILKARSALIMSQPFFGALAMRLIVQERGDIKTMATDGTFLYYCRAFLDWVSEADLIFVIAHEVLHCALSHMTRRQGRRWDLWQAATDHVVNLMLQEAGFTVPEWIKYCDPRFRGLGVEEVYAILENEEPKEPEKDDDEEEQDKGQNPQQDQQQGDGEDEEDDDADQGQEEAEDGSDSGQEDQDVTNGSGGPDQTGPGQAGGEDQQGDEGDGQEAQAPDQIGNGPPSPSYGDPGGCGEVLDAAPPHDKGKLDDVASEWQVYTRQAANIARRVGEGRAPGFIEEIIEELNTPQTDWRDTLRRFVDPMTSTKDFTWTKPNVRQMSLGYFTPGLISDGINHVALIIDDSMSVDSELLKRFATECQAALDEGAIDKATVIMIDTDVRHTAEYNKGDIMDFTIKGRGGTRFSPAFAWIKENAPDASVAVYFTDLDCSDFGEEPYFPVLWMAYDSDPVRLKRNMDKVPFGEVIEFNR